MSASKTESSRMLTIQAAAAEMGISVDTVRRRLREGAFSAVRCGGRTLIHRASLDAYIASLPAVGAAGATLNPVRA